MTFNPVAVILRAVQLARASGLTVTFEPGWETRGNGYRSNWVGGIVHHTGTPTSLENPFPTRRILREGHSTLRGPLCNSAGPADGSVHVMAAQAANHAGASGGRSMGPLPTTTLFNPRVFGHEIDYAGSTPMSPGQYRAAVIWMRCVLTALVEAGQISQFDADRIRLHYETSITGKWDAGYKQGTPIDAGAMRRAVAAVSAPAKEDDMATPAENWGYRNASVAPVGWDAYRYLLETYKLAAANQATLAAIAKDPDITPAALAAVVNDAVARHSLKAADLIDEMRPLIREVFAETLAGDDAAEAEATVDRLMQRLAEKLATQEVM